MERFAVAQDYNVLALVKGAEQYVFIYDDASHLALTNVLRDWAADPRLSFSFFDAAVLTQKSIEQLQLAEAPLRRSTNPIPDSES